MGPDDHAEEGKDLYLVLQVEAARRFVKQEEAWLLHEGPCDQDFLELAPAHGIDRPQCQVSDVQLVDDGLDLLDILPPDIPADVRASSEQDGIKCQDRPGLTPLRYVGKQPCHLVPPKREKILIIEQDPPCLGTKQRVDTP